MKIGIFNLATNDGYRKLLYGWIWNHFEYFLPEVERVWYVATDITENPAVTQAPMPLNVIKVPSESVHDTWRHRWITAENCIDDATAQGCTHFWISQSSHRNFIKIDEEYYKKNLEHSVEGCPVSIRWVKNAAHRHQSHPVTGRIEYVKKYVHFLNSKYQNDDFWREAEASGLCDEYMLDYWLEHDLKGLVGTFVDGVSNFYTTDCEMDGWWFARSYVPILANIAKDLV